MRFDVEFDSGAFYPAAAIAELAELAEERGFAAIWKGESNSTDPIVPPVPCGDDPVAEARAFLRSWKA